MLLSLTLLACTGPAVDTAAPAVVYPRLAVLPEHRDLILERVDTYPYDWILAEIQERAAADYVEFETEHWDYDAHGDNARTAQANAALAWLYDDHAAAEKARAFLADLPADWETNDNWDVNIRMPAPMMGAADTWDLLMGAGLLPDDEAEAARETLVAINEQFYERYVLNDIMRQVTLGYSQNNHPIRTASAIGYTALAFPDHGDAAEQLDWAVSELSYLWGETGQYVQPDGGISEGPHYYAFGLGPALAFFVAMENALPADASFSRDCINRQDVDPWAGHGCVDGEAFTFENPLYDPRFHAAADWSVDMRTPLGWRAPLADSYFRTLNGGALLTGFEADGVAGGGHFKWDWLNSGDDEPPVSRSAELHLHHLAYMDPDAEPTEPPWTTRFLTDAGAAVFRTGWGDEDLWLLLVAESGSARKTLHDHVDGTSFSLAAYGDYLLVDPGYYKPNELDNAVTAHADSHNVILIDGQGAPDKGLLQDFGDADAFLEHGVDGETIEYIEAHQTYEETAIERSLVFARGRYFLVADRLESESTSDRLHSWRLGGWAGEDVGHTFELWDCTTEACGARFARERGGVDVHLASTSPGLRVTLPERVDGAAPHVEEMDRDRNIQHHAVIDGEVTANAPDYLAVLAPFRVGDTGADGPLEVTALALGEGVAGWLIDESDVAILRAPGAAESFVLPDGTAVSTDAELTWMALDGSAGLIARGSAASVDGVEVVAGDAASGVVVVE